MLGISFLHSWSKYTAITIFLSSELHHHSWYRHVKSFELVCQLMCVVSPCLHLRNSTQQVQNTFDLVVFDVVQNVLHIIHNTFLQHWSTCSWVRILRLHTGEKIICIDSVLNKALNKEWFAYTRCFAKKLRVTNLLGTLQGTQFSG